jgi:hypothetical protein
MGFELVFGLVGVRELLLEDGVFMGGFLLGFDSMMLVGWAGKFSSTGPARDAAHERNVEGGSFHGGGGEVVCQRRQWRERGGGDCKQNFTKNILLGFSAPQSASNSPAPGALQRLTVRSVKFIRWLRVQLFLQPHHQPAIAASRQLYAVL